MNINIDVLNNNKPFIEFLKKEIVLILALSLGIFSSFWTTPKLEYIDFKVLILLFNLMIVVAAYNDLQVLDTIAISMLKRSTSYKKLSLALVGLTFFASMLVTNDVALITFVPLTLIIGKKVNVNVLKLVIFQTLAANLGSSLTPMGNPQNLYIYSFYNIHPWEFFKITAPLMVLGIVFLFVLINTEKNSVHAFELEAINMKDKTQTIIFSVLFFIIILSVFHVIDYKITFILTIITVFILNKKLFLHVDYSLLITFIGFFIFIGNISNLHGVKSVMSTFLGSETSTYFSGILLSQVISNVPATMLLSKFTTFYKDLLLGANIGGMGTLIASLASVISYKLYANEYSYENSRYIKTFTAYNLIGLVIFVPIIYFLLRFL
ncbi:SLC13 family permease [Clostridium sp.]|uniref:SLC13 family permease n=1 Tax=Clostridium sp. TaxID=1506 RepID=UPI002FCB84DD